MSNLNAATYDAPAHARFLIDQHADHRPYKGSRAPITPGSELYLDLLAVEGLIFRWDVRRKGENR